MSDDAYFWQPFPDNPQFITLDPPTVEIPDDAEVRSFPHHEIFLDEGEGTFIQTRSSPNWQGGMMTFSTCKQHLRTFKEPKDWLGVYLAGFTPKTDTGANWLLYVARVDIAFESNYDLHEWLHAEYPDILQAKLAIDDPCGDVYTPKQPVLTGENRFVAGNFHPPPPDHTRSELQSDGVTPKWHKDIEYRGNGGRHPPVFALGPASLWTRPKFQASVPLHRSGFKSTGKQLKERVRA